MCVYIYLSIHIYIYIYICLFIYVFIYFSRVGRCGDPMFGICYVEKGVLACTRVYVLKDMCSHAGESTIS